MDEWFNEWFTANFPFKGSVFWNGFIFGQATSIMVYCLGHIVGSLI